MEAQLEAKDLAADDVNNVFVEPDTSNKRIVVIGGFSFFAFYIPSPVANPTAKANTSFSIV